MVPRSTTTALDELITHAFIQETAIEYLLETPEVLIREENKRLRGLLRSVLAKHESARYACPVQVREKFDELDNAIEAYLATGYESLEEMN